MIFGVRSKYGYKILECNPFDNGAEIPLAEGETLFCYNNEEELAEATKLYDAAMVRDSRPWWMRFLHLGD